MPILSPVQAAKVANGVYALRENSVGDAKKLGFDLGVDDLFTVGDGARFTGRSGGLVVWHPISGFGHVAAGTGQFQGDVLIACRGTAVFEDWLTDGNISTRTGPLGSPVHAGFQDTFQSFVGQIDHALDQIARSQTIGTVHCVGHSLGGALATLTAAHCSQRAIGRPELYTFGSPRVGGRGFASSLSQRLGRDHIHRVYHFADPVPMVPLWPFTHVPYGSDGIVIGGDRTALIKFSAHSMENSYLPATAGLQWSNLSATTNNRTAGEMAEAWLKAVANGREGIVPGGAFAFSMLGHALRWIIDQSIDIITATVGTAFIGLVSVLDGLAILLERAAQITARMSMYVTTLVGAIMRFAGMAAQKGVELTTAFIRWALKILFAPIRMMAQQATHLLR